MLKYADQAKAGFMTVNGCKYQPIAKDMLVGKAMRAMPFKKPEFGGYMNQPWDNLNEPTQEIYLNTELIATIDSEAKEVHVYPASRISEWHPNNIARYQKNLEATSYKLIIDNN